MGRPMAQNVLAKYHDLLVYDVHHEAVESLNELGATVSQSPKDVAAQVDYIITMLPNNACVLEVYQGENGILKSVKKGALLIDSSTVDPDVSKAVAATAEAQGVMFLDAPVSGGVNAARLGQLTFMVGGPSEVFPVAQDLLFTMGARVVHCGPVGSGQATKICNNMLLGISMIGTSEAMTLGIRLGLDPKVLMNIVNSSSGRCWSSEVYSPVPGTMNNVPSSNDYKGGFGTKLMAKDLGLAQEAAARTTTPTPLGSLAYELYCTMVDSGFADKDFSSVYQFLTRKKVTIIIGLPYSKMIQ
ncbi:3-hydroxyisobutyrate dehydrogenase, mitochondrial isoform X2 [Zootermopsis nevadensis]|nr:3-hydroxyisobutyrate dehydrogenase, mitochondrial isoform X2 [Zootermopsis nevadensis]XP_021936394.1 3-hydroxyisobutyrate dehydrogenase, mitochondrial isoform X2 [Zootermopsis nevadensis]XP_021936395.1 3-hydroxyisobutyrate dehydrogenase, mitochondrial isoform X2 [Zootermopsis nevadensis]XP_021936396.1 3-hydroxyisobutyrate dehydrogenase, mitochondrial isoform X2 [Zootermopsis nevadensis]